MTHVFQSILTGPEADCMSACIATLLKLPLSEVPNFHHGPGDFMTKVEKWLWARNIPFLTVYLGDGARFKIHGTPGTPCIASGEYNGAKHSVVGEIWNGHFRMTFDPFPSGGGIQEARWVHFLIRN